MSRWLSIDYGEKRIGIAISDPLKIIVTPHTTIDNISEDHVINELLSIFKKQKVERVIIGLPLNMEGDETVKSLEIRKFFDTLSAKTDLPLVLWDERFSTAEASDILKQKGKTWQESKAVIDQIAAAVILKSYMDVNSRDAI